MSQLSFIIQYTLIFILLKNKTILIQINVLRQIITCINKNSIFYCNRILKNDKNVKKNPFNKFYLKLFKFKSKFF